MDRSQFILRHIDKKALGLEIGPIHAPIAPKREGFSVHIIDHLDKKALLEKYKEHNIDLSKIEDVDFVADGRSYAELTGRRNAYGWVIASHVIEHMPDLIGFLKNCEEVLTEAGTLALVVPDKRYCFDYYRPLTTVRPVVDAHIQGNHIHTPGTVAEYFLNIVRRGPSIAWARGNTDTFSNVHGLDEARRGIHDVQHHGSYLDVHAWCFTPSSFRLLIRDLNELGYTKLKEVEVLDFGGGEFFAVLSRSGCLPKESRLELLDRINAEIEAAAKV